VPPSGSGEPAPILYPDRQGWNRPPEPLVRTTPTPRNANNPAATSLLESLPRLLLRTEGGAVFAAALAVYVDGDFGWLPLLVLFLAPDLTFVGYAAGPRVGAAVYNAAHTYVGPLALVIGGIIGDSDLASQLGLIWAAHIGIDRLLGYGLKYPTRFKDTHFQRV
jgi:hypothetical protein